jgi:predicted ATPase/class 3 adenylate cyclase
VGLGVPEQSSLPEGRLALLFTDIEGSTRLLHELGDPFGDLLDDHDRILRGIWAEHGGVEVDHEGDAFFVVFTDHEAAAAAAADVVRGCARHVWPGGVELRVRMGLHSGEPKLRGRRYWGVDVHYAARLCSAASGGQVLLSSSMRSRLPRVEVDPLGEHGLKDFATPRELFQLVVDGAGCAAFPPPRTLSVLRTNLPSISTPVVGRDDVLSDLEARLLSGRERLVTVVGRGGVGKTRVSIAAAERLAPRFHDGVALAALASLTSEPDALRSLAQVAGAASSGGGDPAIALTAHLERKRMLLVVDNAEHLPALGPALAGLIEAAPGLSLLVTSQAPLGVRSESVVRLPPLGLPAAADLFAEVVQRRDPTFALSAENEMAVARLCAVVEGMPLALELAAARASLLGVDRLVAALEQDPDALGAGPVDLPERQRGIRAALDWTVGLLDDRSRTVFTGLGTFAEAWSLAQAEQLFLGELTAAETWEALARLVDLSLVVQRGDGRFTMPERVRRHSRELLRNSGMESTRRRRHAELFAEALDAWELEERLDFTRVKANITDALVETEWALHWAVDADPPAYARLVASAGGALHATGKLAAYIDAARRMLGSRCGSRHDAYLRLADGLAHMNTDPVAAVVALENSLRCLEQMGKTEDVLIAADWLVIALGRAGRVDDAAAVLDAVAPLARQHPDLRWGDVMDGIEVGFLIHAGRYPEAERIINRSQLRPGRTDVFWFYIPTFMGDCAFVSCDFPGALAHYAEMLRRFPVAHLNNSLCQVQGIAACLAAMGDDEEAIELLAGIDEVWRSRTGHPGFAIILPGYDAPLRASGARLGPDAAAQARARGASLDYEELRARAFELADHPHPRPASP